MENIIGSYFTISNKGRMDRRQLIRSIALAATAAARRPRLLRSAKDFRRSR